MENHQKIKDFFFDFEEIKARKVRQEKRKQQDIFFDTKTIRFSKNTKGDSSYLQKQVVVKNISNLNKQGFKNALNYVIKNSDDFYCIDEDGNHKEAREIFKEWNEDFGTKANSKDVWHLCFSMRENVSPRNMENLLKATQEVMDKNFWGYSYVFVPHSHQNNPHIHILLNKRNIFTQKKLHFKERSDIRIFFNTLRNDFATALNARGYNYQNKSRLEKDLQKEIESLKENKFQSKVFVNEILQKEQITLGKKLENFDKKIKKSKDLLQNLYNKKNTLLIQALENQRDNNRIYFKQFKELKIYNERIKDLSQTTKSMIKQHSTLKKEFIRLDNYNHGKEVGDFYSSLQEKKKYIEFVEKNYLRKNLSKNQVALIERFKREIALSEQSFRENTKEYLEHRAIMDSIFSANFKNANGFRLLRVQNELFNNSLACALDESLSKRYDENGKCVKNLIKMRYSYLANSLSKKDKIKEFEFKEIEALSRDLELKNAELLNALSLKVLRDSKKSAKEKLAQQKNISKTLESKSSAILQSTQKTQENRVNAQDRGR